MTRTNRSSSEFKHDRAGLKGLRGLAKKNGGGGNYTWGKPGDEISSPVFLDKRDPNYESSGEVDLDEELLLKDFQKDSEETAAILKIKKDITKKITFFFKTNTCDDFIQDLHNFIFYSSEDFDILCETVKQLVLLSCSGESYHRALVSICLIKLFPSSEETKLISLKNSFAILLSRVGDYELDIPRFAEFLAVFLARGIKDEVIAPRMITELEKALEEDEETPTEENKGLKVIQQMKDLLNAKGSSSRLMKIWGVDPLEEEIVPSLKKEINLLLEEYFLSKDAKEAGVLIKQLQPEYFGHEVIKRGIVLSLEKSKQEKAMMSCLFKFLSQDHEGLISAKQFMKGFKRVYSEVDELELDNPGASGVIKVFEEQCVQDNCLSAEELSEAKFQGEELRKEKECDKQKLVQSQT